MIYNVLDRKKRLKHIPLLTVVVRVDMVPADVVRADVVPVAVSE
jgi:hypothetical protein